MTRGQSRRLKASKSSTPTGSSGAHTSNGQPESKGIEEEVNGRSVTEESPVQEDEGDEGDEGDESPATAESAKEINSEAHPETQISQPIDHDSGFPNDNDSGGPEAFYESQAETTSGQKLSASPDELEAKTERYRRDCLTRNANASHRPTRARSESPRKTQLGPPDQFSDPRRHDRNAPAPDFRPSGGISDDRSTSGQPRAMTNPYPPQSDTTAENQTGDGRATNARGGHRSRPPVGTRSGSYVQSTTSQQSSSSRAACDPRPVTDTRRAGRQSTPKEVSSSKTESADSTTLRLQELTYQYRKAIVPYSPNVDAYFCQFAGILIEEIKQAENKTKQSENRINALSEEMLAGRDRYQPTPDGDFQALMNQLREDVKMLGRDLFNAAKEVKLHRSDLRDILEKRILSHMPIDSVWENKGNGKLFIQSAIWKVLKDCLFNNPLLVFGNEGQAVGKTWNILFSGGLDQASAENFGLPSPSELSEKWRSLTGTRLEEKYGTNSSSYGSEARNGLETLMDMVTENVRPYSAQPAWYLNLDKVLNCASKLAIMIAKQRSRLELYVPQAASSDQERQVDQKLGPDGKIIDIDEELTNPTARDICFVVAPGLRRWGDSMGTRLDHYLDLEAAQVKCWTVD